jgi:hypothetical protein
MSIPSKRGVSGITNATLPNILPELKEDIHARLFEGVTIEDFVQYAWCIPVDDINCILSRQWSLDLDLLRKYRKAKPESEMHDPFGRLRLATNLIADVRSSLG